jgi:hypothetical protein
MVPPQRIMIEIVGIGKSGEIKWGYDLLESDPFPKTPELN